MKRKQYIKADEEYALIELTQLAKRYPEIDWTKPTYSKCAVCHLPATYLLCFTIHEDRLANYEPNNPEWRMLVFELRSMCNTNFEFPVCESHQFGEPQ